MSFEMARMELKNQGIDVPKMVSIQNSYSLLVRSAFETDLAETCCEKHCNIGLLAYSPLAGGALSGKYLNVRVMAAVVKSWSRHFSSCCVVYFFLLDGGSCRHRVTMGMVVLESR